LIFNKEITLFCLFLTLWVSQTTAQIALPIGGLGGDEVVDVVTYEDKIILGGTFQQDLNANWSRGGSSVFLQQYDLQGQLVWEYILGSSNNDQLKAMHCSSNGTIFSTGTFSDSLFLGAQDTFIYSAQTAIFISKHHSSGQLHWAKAIQGQSLVLVEGILSDSQNNSYVTGSFQDSFWVDATHLLVGNSTNTPFVFKLDSIGNVLWARSPQTSDEGTGIALALSDQNELYWTGQFKGYFALSTDSIRAHWVYNDLFLVKLDSNGIPLMQQHYGGVYNNSCSTLKWQNGRLYLGGSFMGVLEINQVRLVTNFRHFDAFVVQLNSDGTANWGIQSQTDSDCFLEDIAFYEDKVILCGHYLDSFLWEQESYFALEASETFQVTLDSSGQTLGAKSWIGNGFDLTKANTVHPNGQLISVGGFQESMLLDSIEVQATGFSSGFLVIEPILPLINSIKNPIFSLVPILIQPNPAKDSALLSCNNCQISSWTLYNLNGQIVHSGSESLIYLNNIASGTYSLQVITDQGIGIEKIVVH
jgi:hypothetical protein